MIRITRRVVPLVATILLALAGCGAHTTRTITVTRPATPLPTISRACPPGKSFMGCATPKTHPHGLGLAPVTGPEFPDVSSWQGATNWPQVAAWQRAYGWRTGGVFKLGEYVPDPYAAWNAAHTRGLSWRAGYWFVRNTGCVHETSQIIAAAHAAGLRLVILDIEVPEAAGYSGCLVPAVRAAGFVVVIYTGSGTWPGGLPQGAGLWDAAYGPGPDFQGLWTARALAWQFTDGRYGWVTSIPGLGAGDVSVDWGLSKLAAPSRLVCFGPHAQLVNRTCKQVRPLTASRSRARDATGRALERVDSGLRVHRCVLPYRRGVCIRLGRTAATLGRRERYFAALVTATLKRYGG